MADRRIRVPANDWMPRPYQMPSWSAVERGVKRIALAWHRRAGKDDICLRALSVRMFERVGNYWFMLPEANQSRKAIWEAINPHTGVKRVDETFPTDLVKRRHNGEMMLELVNGSTMQVVGSDNYNSLVGSPPIGMVFSEYALADPRAWAMLRPILRENGGWAMFNSTVRGANHFKTFMESHAEDDDWFTEILPANKTDVFTPEQLEAERQDYIRENGETLGEALYRQEFLCDFSAPVLGAYYGDLMRKVEDEDRVCAVPYDPRFPVTVAFDLGNGQNMALWFVQAVGREVRVIEFMSGSQSEGLDWYAGEITRRYPLVEELLLPHDGDNDNMHTGKTTKAAFEALGFKARVVPKLSVRDGINAVRALLPRCVFDKRKTAPGVEALKQYQAQWNDKAKVLSAAPLHNWASHPADAFRYLAVGLKDAPRSAGRINYPRMANVA